MASQTYASPSVTSNTAFRNQYARRIENLFEHRPMLRQSSHQKNYIRRYPVEMIERLEAVGFRFRQHQAESSVWHCGWEDPLGQGFVCERAHASRDACFDGKCVWRIYQTFKFEVAARSGRHVNRHYLDGVFRATKHDVEEHLGMVILPEGVSRKAWPAAWFDKSQPDGADNSDDV